MKLNVPDLEEIILEVIKTLSAQEREVQDDHKRWHNMQIRPYRTSDNRIDGAVITLSNINALKLNEQILTAFADFKTSVIETMRDPLLVLDANFRVKMANQSYFETFKVTRAETENHRLEKLGNGQWDIPRLRELLNSVLAGQTFDEYEVDKNFPGIGRKVITVSGRQIRGSDPQEELLLIAFSDITDRKQIEEALKQSRLQLESTNAELQEFAHVASHDLQEPLRKVITFTERLKIQTLSLGLEAKDYCEKIYTAGIRMKRVIEDILHFSNITSINEAFEDTDLNRIVQDVLSDLELKITETHTQIEVQALPHIQANKSLMRHLFQNLISNSIKYVAKGTTPHILIESHSYPHSMQIRFKDNGIGFDEKYLDRIFRPFQRLHTKHEYEGTGIGLSICQKIVGRHGGKITAQSKPGEGSTFIVDLPLRHDTPNSQPRA